MYHLAIIQFAGKKRLSPYRFLTPDYKEYEPASLKNDRLRFLKGDLCVQASGRFPDMQSGISLVSSDLETIDDLFPEIRELASRRVIDKRIVYTRAPTGRHYEVIDCSLPPFDPLFDRVIQLKDKKKFPKVPDQLKDLNLGHFHLPGFGSIREGTLRQAVENALNVYRRDAVIRSLIPYDMIDASHFSTILP